MKQKTLLSTLALGLFSVVVLQSNDNGPVNAGTGNRTGSGGSTASCDGTGCHSANNVATTVQVLITDTGSTSPVTSYTPGKKYYLRVVGSNASLNKYGFQASTVKSTATSTQAGTLTTGGSSTANTAVRTSGSLQIFEHFSVLSGTNIAGTWVYGANCYWTAPAAGTGAVKIYGIINAVDGSGTVSGDKPNAASVVTINEASSSVATTTAVVDFKVYPNPASNFVNIKAEKISTGICNIHVYDMRGKVIASQTAEATNGEMNTIINSSKWAAGIHFVQIEKDGQSKVISVVKQ